MQVVTLDGFLSRHVGVNIAADLAPLNPLAVTSASGLNSWPKWLDGRIDRQVAGLESFVVAGFSAGAKAAARLAERNPRCVGLIFVSGTEWRPGERWVSRRVAWSEANGYALAGADVIYVDHHFRLYGWHGFPVLCLATQGEKWALISGTMSTRYALEDAGADVGDWFWKPAPTPTDPDTGEPYKRPHLAGVAHHLPAITDWLNNHFNHGAQNA